jgi:hypothetical protein
MQHSVHPPSAFIRSFTNQLLPSWSHPVESVLILLQPSGCDLLEQTPITEFQKQQLREQFLEWGRKTADQLHEMGFAADLFDPRTGLPVLSTAGSLRLDDVAVVQSCLGYPTCDRCGCSVILHPTWGSAVYPSILVSSAPPRQVESLLHAGRIKVGV